MSRLYQLLVQNAQQFPEREALVETEIRWTYRDFLTQVDQAAAGFQTLQIQPGDRVGLMLYNQKEFLVSFYALRKLGIVVVPINIQMLPQDIGYVIQHSGIRHLVIADSLLTPIGHLPLQFIVVGDSQATTGGQHLTFEKLLTMVKPTDKAVETSETDLAFLLYTSGTTGHPKGVMLAERNILANLEGFEQVVEFNETDRLLLALPLFHAYGLIVGLTGLVIGACLILVPRFHPKAILEALVQEKATILPLVPTLYTVILELIQKHGDVQLPHIRFCVSGGASLPAPLLHKIEAVLQTSVIEGYGLTETAPVLTVNDPKIGSIPGSVGKPLPNVQIKILREDNTECPVGEVGEIVAKGDNIMMGYYNLPQETEAALVQGWLRTGDLGHFDETGNLFISGGRKKDLIIKAGENISPRTIEEVLYQHEAVREAAVIGIPDEKKGEAIAACIALKEGHAATSQEIRRFAREHLLPAYVPEVIEFFDELPKNPTGKVVKKLLREMLEQRIKVSP